MRKITLWMALAAPVWAQMPLSLREAMEMALKQHPSALASQSGVDQADSRIRQAQSGKLPKLNVSESWQGSNNPVFVFSSLLVQRQFSESNFALDSLNNPRFLNNFQSLVTVEQPLYDASATRNAVRAAGLGKDIAAEEKRRTEQELIGRVVSSYYSILLANDLEKVAGAAAESAKADLERAESVRNAGMSTDADVLSIRVHLAAMREQQIRRHADVQVAEAGLNEAIGAALDSHFLLTTKLSQPPVLARTLAESDTESEHSRPEVRKAQIGIKLAETQSASAHSLFLPQVFLRAGAEADRQQFINKGGANWMAGITLRWNVFNGYADQARANEAAQALAQARAEERQASQMAKLQVRRAAANFDAAKERGVVTESAVSEAEESLRIIKNRYDAGLTTITELLRGETALLDAKSRQLAVFYEQRAAGVALEIAAGTLSVDSEVLR